MSFIEENIGKERVLGTYTFTAEEIIAFARKYDPQPFHIDEEAAKNSLFGGLCASGWHTTAIFMKLNVASMVQGEQRNGATGRNAADLWPLTGIREPEMAEAGLCRGYDHLQARGPCHPSARVTPRLVDADHDHKSP
ncbi:hypothetical protein H721_01501 [Brucella ovis IntaBari-2006-46-332]|nr:hypothetical protein C010_01484 [Brucella ovis 80/125]ENR08085.1 hypothetical protein C961_01471 [Brucella ovis F8/05B]ENS95016.1 hypothetical protein B999_01810 [Brucella ovis 63/96]ENS99160.1 hypothetical protein C009_01495 [Brucella ovis 81/8]ENT78099.1 hypothetical protein H712_01475 [Brucella ovis IntaBari-2009-88-4]ENT80423.1 hypothetical protein H720_01483 [Brucella ovis IntaBari-2006-46-348]ENT83819.1 hypothetical protein H713_01479 [Brucella ovis IntaBari-2010-47-268]ENT88613.1 h